MGRGHPHRPPIEGSRGCRPPLNRPTGYTDRTGREGVPASTNWSHLLLRTGARVGAPPPPPRGRCQLVRFCPGPVRPPFPPLRRTVTTGLRALTTDHHDPAPSPPGWCQLVRLWAGRYQLSLLSVKRPARALPSLPRSVTTGSLGRPVGDAPWPTDQLVSRPPLPRPVPTGPSVAPPRAGR